MRKITRVLTRASVVGVATCAVAALGLAWTGPAAGRPAPRPGVTAHRTGRCRRFADTAARRHVTTEPADRARLGGEAAPAHVAADRAAHDLAAGDDARLHVERQLLQRRCVLCHIDVLHERRVRHRERLSHSVRNGTARRGARFPWLRRPARPTRISTASRASPRHSVRRWATSRSDPPTRARTSPRRGTVRPGRCRTIPAPSTTTSSVLEAVSCTSLTFCLATGWQSVGDAYTPLTQEWNGSAWSIASAGDWSDGELNGVSCSSSTFCAAVGDYYVGSTDTVLFENWNGGAWVAAPNSSTPTRTRQLLGRRLVHRIRVLRRRRLRLHAQQRRHHRRQQLRDAHGDLERVELVGDAKLELRRRRVGQLHVRGQLRRRDVVCGGGVRTSRTVPTSTRTRTMPSPGTALRGSWPSRRTTRTHRRRPASRP